MTPMNNATSIILCLAASICWAEDKLSDKSNFFTHENPAVQLALSTPDAEVQRLVNLGLKECLYGCNEGAYNYFAEALREEPGCILAHIGMLMIHPLRSEAYRQHLQQLNNSMQDAVLTPVEEWYVATFLQYLNGDYAGAAQAFRERAARYRRDNMAACWDIVLNHQAGEQGGSLLKRADALLVRLPDSPLAHYLRALVEEHAESPSEQAISAAETAAQLTKRAPHPLIHQLAGHLLFRSGKATQAMPHFQAILRNTVPTAEAYMAARLYQIAVWVQSGDKKQWVQALKAARQLSTEGAAKSPASDAETLLHWEGRTQLLRLLVLQETPPAGAAINMAAQNCNAPENSPLKLVQDCLVAAIRTRSLADSGRTTSAAEQLPKAEQFFARLQREGEALKRMGGITRTCYIRAERACAAALFRARVALYKDSADIWQPHLDALLNTPEPRMLPPILPQTRRK